MIENMESFEKNEMRKLLMIQYHIPFNWAGVKYLITATPYVVEKIQLNEKIVMNELYQFVAKKHKTTSLRVERDIRYIHDERGKEIMEKMGCERITNQSFIINLVMELMEKFEL